MQPTRLKKRRQFVRVTNKGRKLVSSGLVLLYAPNDTEANAVGFTVTKKIGNAVTRNRIRRRLREIVRLYLPKFKKTGYDFVVVGRKATADRPFYRLKKDFLHLLKEVE
ncbi:MAG: ribonuclease P protein component [Alphaproteobacteria bacterium]|nr:ribonuclease P protein component [Alphaproteobacteria bacterium]